MSLVGAAFVRLFDRIDQALLSRWAPWVIAGLTGLLVAWLMGGLNPEPWVYDEAAYLLQAKIFATGHWSAPGRPLPEFFEQLHVFVTPRLVPKYPPGHALLMVPGIWLGMAALIPLVATTATGGLIFRLARGLGGHWVGLLTWLVWITAPEELYLRPSYLSQTSTTLMWLGVWWSVERWRQGGGRWLIVASLLVALAAITRPITAIALALPVAVVVLRRLWEERSFTPALAGLIAALPILALAPLWSFESTGRAFPTPYSEYSRVYVPWNMPGFSIDRSPPRRAEIPAITRFRTEWLPIHEGHTVARLPAIALARLKGIGTTFFGDGGFPDGAVPWRWVLLGAALIGVVRPPRAMWPALAGAPILFLTMLWLASRPLWTVYYFEIFPVLAFVVALGVVRVAEGMSRMAGASWRAGPTPRFVSGVILAGTLVAVPGTVERVVRAKQQQEDLRLVQTDLRRAVEQLPGRAIVFIGTGTAHRPFESYVMNEPDLDRARVWLVNDRGEDNKRLLSFAKDRAGYFFNPGSGQIHPLGPR